jgi:LuxR family maltose regulon positive regulatory protein
MEIRDQIMSVKLKMPQPRKNYISRHALFGQLTKITEHKVTLVKAGAGSGKTTLLASFIKEKALTDVKWITLEENANQVFIFWKYVMEALKEYILDVKNDLFEYFDGNIQAEYLWQFLPLLLNKLNHETRIILVLDDFHVITDPFLVSTLDYFIENLPDNLHLVLLTRNLPAIYLGALAAEGGILVLEEEAIRFKREESMDFLTNTMNLKRENGYFNEMIEASGGWIVGLQLLAVSLKDRDSNAPWLSISARMIDDYITREIFVYLTAKEQEFLIKTGILRYFNEEICRRYLPEVSFPAMMESILKKNLFVIHIDESAGVYRYHSILSEYLVKMADRLKFKEKEALQRLAADIYYEMGDYEESLYHLFAVKDYGKIMEQLLSMPQTTLTYAYMMKVPMEEIAVNVDFAFQYFFCYYAGTDAEICEKIYRFVISNIKENKTFEAFKHTDMFFTEFTNFKLVQVLSLDQIKELHLNPVTTSFLLIKEAYFLYATSHYSEALEYLTMAEETYHKTGNIYLGIFVMAVITQIYEDMGELNLCLRLYQEMETMLPQIPSLTSSYYIGISGVYIRQLKLQKAHEALENARKSLPEDSDNIEKAYLYTLAEYYYLTGENDKTDQILLEVIGGELTRNIYFCAKILRYPMYRGSHMELARQFVNSYENSVIDVKQMDCELLFAAILLEDNREDKALEVINTLITTARKTQNKLKIIEGDLLKARILNGKGGNKREILNLFLESISYAVGDEIAHPFWFEKDITEKLKNEFEADLKKKLAKEEWDFIMNAEKPEMNQESLRNGRDLCDLTEREIEVLKELAQGSSNKQIAEKLYISLATVKSHIMNLYGKLGVNNRVAAVNKGLEYLKEKNFI